MESISKKDIFVNYLRMNDKNDMADMVIKYCDENHGIVFNKHPARNEDKFGSIYDYSVSSYSKFSNDSKYSHDSKIMIENGFKSFDSISQSKCSCKNKSTMESIQTWKKEKSDDICIKKKKKGEKLKKINAIGEKSDDKYEIIAPEGKGKFLKFIGENYVYILLENGTYNCYPIELLKLNPSYLKKNTMFNLSFNYKDLALEHTRNILKSKNISLYKNENIFNEENKNSDKYLSFPKEMDYIKDYIIKNDIEEENVSEKDYLVHLFIKNLQSKNEKQDNNCLPNPNNSIIKKNIMMKTLNNEYKIENINYYIPVDYIVSDKEKCNTCF